MPSAICCPECPSTEVDLVGGGDPIEAARLRCVLCRITWPVWEVPHLRAAPDYRQAYGAAPPLAEERAGLVALTAGGAAARDRAGRPVDGGGRRLGLLRQAAVLDRQARDLELDWFRGVLDLAAVEDVALRAGVAAAVLRGLDHDLGGRYVAGPLVPGSIVWDQPGGSRAYVRQEYAAWHSRETRVAADRG
ncbi:hypothetical protein [Streptomyces sp. B6B3]|uniref:hypothetical protein n=1 Tax=Streptomyces sp. B6B3 TaxID=3153570 RepID=UPI00325D604A